MEVSFKAGNLRGCLHCINAPDPAQVALDAQMARIQAKEEEKWIDPKLEESSEPRERPEIGDVVEILGTPHVRKVSLGMASLVGRKVTISADDKSDCPFRVCYNRSESPYSFSPNDVKLVVKAADNTTGKPRRILEFTANKLKVLCSDSTAFMNFHRALQTCIQAHKSINAVDFQFQFNGQNISSDGNEGERFLSELKVGDVVTYTSKFNKSYGTHSFMHLRITGACVAQDSAVETPWERPKFLDDDFLPRCIQATSEKTRDTANWRLCHMRFDLMKHPKEFEGDDLHMVRLGPDDASFGSTSLRRRGPGKHRREKIVQRMSLDLAGELDLAQASDSNLSSIKIDR